MFLPRDEGGDLCPSGASSCTPSSAITGSNDPDSPSSFNDGYNPNYHSDGPQRYIGIVMVAVIAIAMLAYWLFWRTKKRRQDPIEVDDQNLYLASKSETPMPTSTSKSRRSWFCLGRRRAPPATPPSPAPSTPSSADPEKGHFDLKELELPARAAQRRPPKTPGPPRMISEVEKNRRRMLEASAPRGKAVKEVSGGMVIYTTTRGRGAGPKQLSPTSLSPTLPIPEAALRPPRRSSRIVEDEEQRGRRRSPVRGRNVDLNAEWHMEHVNGVRYEARTPPERKRTSNTDR